MAIDTTSPRTRRALLAGAVGGVAALVAHATGGPTGARAATDGNVILGNFNEADNATTISNTNSLGTGFAGKAIGGAGIWAGSKDGAGVYASSDKSNAVEGRSQHGVGIKGQSGPARPSIVGRKETGGVAVQGEIANSSSGWTAMYGVTNGPGVGVVGENTANGPGTWGKANGAGDGVYGESANGRGGHFRGKKAQLKLDPSTAATHPSSGAAGDIFLDSAKRLWLCKGGTSWVRIV